MEQINLPDESIVNCHVYGNKIVSGEIIALEDISSTDNKNSIRKKPSIPDITTNHKHSSSSINSSIQHKVYLAALLLSATLLVIGVMQIPITLFYTDPAFDSIDITDIVDFKECQVLAMYVIMLYGLSGIAISSLLCRSMHLCYRL